MGAVVPETPGRQELAKANHGLPIVPAIRFIVRQWFESWLVELAGSKQHYLRYLPHHFSTIGTDPSLPLDKHDYVASAAVNVEVCNEAIAIKHSH